MFRLSLAEAIEEAATDVPALPFVEWLVERPAWHKEFFYNLQSLSQTALGEPLLTTWLSAERFWALLNAGRGAPAIDNIAQRTAQWRGLALDEVYFDFYERGGSAAEARVELSAEPITS